MSKKHTLECGCTWDDAQMDTWKPCPAHVDSSLYKVRKAHAEVVSQDEINWETEGGSIVDSKHGDSER